MDCGPTCLRMIAEYHGKSYSLNSLRKITNITRTGVSLGNIAEAAEKIGYRSLAARVDFNTLVNEVSLPCIGYWKQRHFIVIYKIKKDKIYVADPAHGLVKYSKKEFKKGWTDNNNLKKSEGYILLLETTPKFFDAEEEEEDRKDYGFRFFF